MTFSRTSARLEGKLRLLRGGSLRWLPLLWEFADSGSLTFHDYPLLRLVLRTP